MFTLIKSCILPKTAEQEESKLQLVQVLTIGTDSSRLIPRYYFIIKITQLCAPFLINIGTYLSLSQYIYIYIYIYESYDKLWVNNRVEWALFLSLSKYIYMRAMVSNRGRMRSLSLSLSLSHIYIYFERERERNHGQEIWNFIGKSYTSYFSKFVLTLILLLYFPLSMNL